MNLVIKMSSSSYSKEELILALIVPFGANEPNLCAASKLTKRLVYDALLQSRLHWNRLALLAELKVYQKWGARFK